MPKVWNPYHGWQPFVFETTKQQTTFCKMPTRQPVAEIEALVAQSGESGGRLSCHFPPEAARQLMQASGAPSPPVLHIDSSTLVGVLDAVRSALLNWSLKLEEDGVLGNEIGFTEEEKAVAATTSYNVNNFFGPTSGSHMQIASPGSEQIYQAALDLEALRGFLDELDNIKATLPLPTNANEELEADLRTLHSQLASPRPKVSILRESLRSVQRILEGGAGGALGNAAAMLLRKLLALLQ